MLQSRPITTLLGPLTAPTGGTTGTVLLRGLGGAPAVPAGPFDALFAGRRCTTRRWRHSRHAHDHAGLGAVDARCRGNRDRLWWNDLPRGDRVARDWASHAWSAPATRQRSCVTARSSPSTPPHGVAIREGAQATTPAPASAPSRGVSGRWAAIVTATKLLVNLSEPSQVGARRSAQRGRRRPIPCGIDGSRGARRNDHPRTLLAKDRGDEFVEQMADALTTFAAASLRDRSPTAPRTFVQMSSAAFVGASSLSRRRPTR